MVVMVVEMVRMYLSGHAIKITMTNSGCQLQRIMAFSISESEVIRNIHSMVVTVESEARILVYGMLITLAIIYNGG